MNTPVNSFLSLTAMRQTNPGLISAQPIGESVKKFIENAKALAEASSTSGVYEFKAHSLTAGEDNKLYCSSVVLVVRKVNQLKNALAYHVLLLADTAEDPGSVLMTINGVPNVEILRVIGDAYDNDYRRTVIELLTRQYPDVSVDNMIDAEAEVIPRGYDYADLALVRRTLINATKAATTQLNSKDPAFRDLSLAHPSVSQLNTQVKLTFNQPQTSNEVGEPVRTDVKIEFAQVEGSTDQRQQGQLVGLNTGEKISKVAELGGFMDLLWAPTGPVLGSNQYAPQQFQIAQNQPSYLYKARYVISQTRQLLLDTLPGQLLTLATVSILRDNSAWMAGFQRPVDATDEFNIHDIGAIGIEANFENNPNGVGRRIDTSRDAFKTSNLVQLLAATVHPEILVSIDVEECGPSSWLNSVFAGAGKGNQGATMAIIEAANLLTNGVFGQLYSGPVMVNDMNRLHTGWWLDAKGNRRDIREIDHLCILNMTGEKDPAIARDWSDTFARTEYPIEIRMAARRKIIESLVSEVHFTGFSQRYTFVGGFLDALSTAVVRCGLTIRPIHPFRDLTGQPRAVASWAQNAGMSQANSGLFTRGYNTQPNVAQGSTSFGRWV